jgi:ketosteroid isomerase-like protein
MSQENVEVVQQVFEAVARRDSKTVLALYDPEVVVEMAPGSIAQLLTSGPVWRGHDGLREFDREWREAFADIETGYEELIDAGEQVIAIARYRVRGRASGISVSGPPQAGVWTLRNGRIVDVIWFPTREEALEAAGLRE